MTEQQQTNEPTEGRSELSGLVMPEGTTHTRDGDFYKVDSRVHYFENGEWALCDKCDDLAGWLDELEPVA